MKGFHLRTFAANGVRAAHAVKLDGSIEIYHTRGEEISFLLIENRPTPYPRIFQHLCVLQWREVIGHRTFHRFTICHAAWQAVIARGRLLFFLHKKYPPAIG
jgi:hypothetical protein